jgi:hypothetical protein
MQGRPSAPVLIGLRAFVLAGAAGGLLARGHIVFGCLLAVAAMLSLWTMIRNRDKDDRDPGPPSFPGTA